MNLEYVIFLVCMLSLFFVFVRGSVIDLKTEYVPDNIVIGSYFCSIIYILLASIIGKTYRPLIIGGIGFGITFIIPYVLSQVIFYVKYFSWRYANKGKELPITEEEQELKENPYISKKSFNIFYAIGIISIVVIGLFLKNYTIIISGLAALIIELILGKVLKRFYIIKYNYAEEKLKEPTPQSEMEDDLYSGIGGGDIILFGSIGIMFGAVGFMVAFLYAVFAHIIIVLFYSIIKKMNPFKYPIPFIPALTIGLLVYGCGLDNYLLHIISYISLLI